jgi:hypothetical protein
MFAVSIADYNERQHRAVTRILDQLDRCNARTEQHYSRVRRHERKPYRGAVSVYVPTAQQPEPMPGIEGVFTAWSYSLSQGGMGFVSPNFIELHNVVVGIHLPDGQTRWFHGDVVRRRQIPNEEFYDYGVAFQSARAEKSSAPDVALAAT